MLGRIIGMFCCILCAFPFLAIGCSGKRGKEPIRFWSGDKTLKAKVTDVPGYNSEMSKLYLCCALAFAATGVICLIHMGVGICFILLECTLGIYVAWRIYKKILLRYS